MRMRRPPRELGRRSASPSVTRRTCELYVRVGCSRVLVNAHAPSAPGAGSRPASASATRRTCEEDAHSHLPGVPSVATCRLTRCPTCAQRPPAVEDFGSLGACRRPGGKCTLQLAARTCNSLAPDSHTHPHTPTHTHAHIHIHTRSPPPPRPRNTQDRRPRLLGRVPQVVRQVHCVRQGRPGVLQQKPPGPGLPGAQGAGYAGYAGDGGAERAGWPRACQRRRCRPPAPLKGVCMGTAAFTTALRALVCKTEARRPILARAPPRRRRTCLRNRSGSSKPPRAARARGPPRGPPRARRPGALRPGRRARSLYPGDLGARS